MSKITQSARGETCQVRIPGICNFDTTTTVFAHLGGAGWALKSKAGDIDLGAYCCSNCHDAVDGRIQTPHEWQQIRLWHHEGMVRTLKLLADKGLIKA